MKAFTKKRIILAITGTVIFLEPLLAQIQWTGNGVRMLPSNASSTNLTAVPDGHGGVFIAAENGTTPDINVNAQWIDGGGNVRWGTSGIVVTNESLNQKTPVIQPDASGGAYVAWLDESVDRIKVQRLNSSGVKQWSGYGFYVTNTTAVQSAPKMISDGLGGIIIVWKDERNTITSGIDLWAQRMDNNGNWMWGPTGKVVSEAPDDQSQHTVISDGSGGILVTWQDYRNLATANKIDIYVQNLTSSGNRSWNVSGNYEGIPVCTAAEDQLNPVITKTGSKFCIAWQDNRGANTDIYAQMKEMSGSNTWAAANGTLICGATGNQTKPEICGDIYDYVIIAWADARTGTQIYAQRMNAAGAAQWTANGTAVINLSYYAGGQKIVSDGAGGGIVTWMDDRNGNYDIYAQHLNSSGTRIWDANGLVLCNATGHQLYPVMISDGSGGSVIMWQDSRSSTSDIYGQLVNDNVTVTAPLAGAEWAGTQQKTITWTLRTSLLTFHHLNILASAVSGDGFPISVASNVSPTALSQTWTPTTVNSSTVQLKFQAYNDQGVKLADFFSGTFMIDSNPPSTFNLLAPLNGAVVDLQPTFQWQASTDALSGLDHYELVIGGVTIKNNLQTTSYTLSSLEKLTGGSYAWYVRAVDKVGQSRPSATWNFTAAEDNTPPNPFDLVSPANNTWTKETNPAFTWQAATDDITGIHHYKLFVDGGASPIADNIPPASTSINTVVLAAGNHTWYVVAVDSALNERQSAQTWMVKIDNVIPHAFDLTSPAHNSWQQTTRPTFNWQASADDGSGLAGYEFYKDGSGSPWVSNIGSAVTQMTLPADKALTDGTHTWYMVAKDVLGNSRASNATYTVKVDATPPVSFQLVSPANNNYVTTASPTLTWQAATDATSGLSKYMLCVDGTTNRDNLTGTSTTPASALSEGAHTWQVEAYDVVGNKTSTSAWNFTVDTEGPAAFNLLAPSAGQTVFHNKPTFSWQTTTDAISGFSHFEFYVDDVKVADNLTAQQTQVTLTSVLANGPHTWKVMAFDQAGKSTTSGPRSFTSQVSAPVITSPASASATEDIYFSYTATATDAENDQLTYTFLNAPSWLTANNAVLSGTPTEGKTGGTFTVKVTDGFFEDTQDVNLTVTPVDDPPHITSPASADAVEDQPFSYTATATDPEGDPIVITYSGQPAWMTVQPAPNNNTIQGSPPNLVTSVTFTVTATANGKTDQLSVTISVQGVDDPPYVTSASSGNATEDILYIYTATAADPENDPITLTYPVKPAWMTVSGAVIQGTPTEGVTSFSFTAEALANGKTAQKVITVTVQAVDDPPVITSATAVNATEEIQFSYTATATDAEGAPITLQFSQLPAWLTVQPSGVTVQGSPPEGITSATFTVTAAANGKTDQKIVTVTIQAVDDPPRITSVLTGNAVEDVLFTYTASATDMENDPIQITFPVHPDWMTVTGTAIGGTPLNGVLTFSFTVTASANGKTDTKTVTVTVQAVNDPVRITSRDTVLAVEDQPVSYTATAADEENDPLTLEFSNVPKWMTVNGTVISGTPLNGVPDTLFTVTARAASQTDTKNITVIITSVNDPPQITSPDSAEIAENQMLSYAVTADDADGPFMVARFINYPDWLKPMGKVIRGTVPSNCPNSGFRVIVSDNHPQNPLSDTLDVTVVVLNVNDPPKFDSSFPRPRFQDPDTVRLVLTLDDYVTDPDDPDNTLTWTYTLPDSQRVVVSIDPVTHRAVIKAARIYSDFHIEFTVTDPHQASASSKLTIGVYMTGVNRLPGFIPAEFALYPNFPNPFNPETTIRYAVPKRSHVILKIYSLTGQEVACLADEEEMPGFYEIKWDGSGMASGLYLCRILADTWHETRRMVLIK